LYYRKALLGFFRFFLDFQENLHYFYLQVLLQLINRRLAQTFVRPGRPNKEMQSAFGKTKLGALWTLTTLLTP
jgi:hypothetical protein